MFSVWNYIQTRSSLTPVHLKFLGGPARLVHLYISTQVRINQYMIKTMLTGDFSRTYGEQRSFGIHTVSIASVGATNRCWYLGILRYSLLPCHHKGLCDTQSNCSCFLGNLHCTRNCRCSWNCEWYSIVLDRSIPIDDHEGKIRWKGCACKKKPKQCTEKCKCIQAGRECDIDLCKNCGSR